MPNLYIIAGPNGAGKTTSAKVLVPEFFAVKYFINADEIARAINPLNPEKAALQAGRLMLSQIDELIKNKEDFVFETTLSAKTYVKTLQLAKNHKYKTHLIFLYLKSAKLALSRVKKRVSEGGHNIPEEVVKRRYERGIYNLTNLYAPLVDEWYVYDNSETPYKIAYSINKTTKIVEEAIWQKIQKL